MNRRELLRFLGASGFYLNAPMFFSGCANLAKSSVPPFIGIKSSSKDDVVLAEGLSYYPLIKWNDDINPVSKYKFGYNNDYIALVSNSKNELFMWVNHESVNSLYVSNYNEKDGKSKTKKQIAIEKKNVGGSFVNLEFKNNKWQINKKHPANDRLDGNSKISFYPKQKVAGSYEATGTFANCAGGVTPWGTVLTCEENTHDFVGDLQLQEGKEVKTSRIEKKTSWEAHEQLPPQHYGWVVEYNPKEKKAKKLVKLGRFAHECATCTSSKDGRTVVYMGDDKNNEHLYKFISDVPGDLGSGQLYVADTTNGLWKLLDYNSDSKFQAHFKNQQQLLVFTRDAAKLVGATPLDRPEDVEIHPKTGDIYVALTNNKPKGNYHGSILRLSEKDNDPLSLSFTSETFKLGGDSFSCPDNLVFDKKGNLWVTSDISGGSIGKGAYKPFGNNGLFCIPTSGKNAGQVIQVASAPNEAEFTGPCFSKDYKTLFISVQHPGEKSKDIDKPHSLWPHNTGTNVPHPAVICIEGPLLQNITT